MSGGRLLGRYQVVRELGRGGMGVVHLGLDTRLERQVAIKIVSLESPAAVARFTAEARVTARCKHPNIVVVHDIGEDDGRPYMVLEYVEGESVQAMLQRGPIAPDRALALLTPVARALAFAHSRGIVHRDLKPANILVTTDGAPKIVDFGIAKTFDEDLVRFRAADRDSGGDVPGNVGATAPHELVGTLHYLSPEQVRGGRLDERIDIWAFGVTLYQLLHGRHPLDGLDKAALLDHLADLDREMPRLDAVAPGLPRGLVELTHWCLEKRPELRVASAAELVVALEALVASPETTPAPAAPPPAASSETGSHAGAAAPSQGIARRARRRRVTTGLVAAAAVMALVAVATMWSSGRRGERASARAPAADSAVEGRIASLAAEVARLDARGASADADRMLDAFLREERDPRGLALGWLERGDRALRHRDVPAAIESYAAAYARASDVDSRRRALLALAVQYLKSWEWTRLAAAMDVHDALPGPHDGRGEALRELLQLAIRAPALAASSSPESRAVARAMLRGRPAGFDLRSALSVDVDGDGVPELVGTEGDELVVRAMDGLRERSRRPLDGVGMVRCAGRGRDGAQVVVAGWGAGRGWTVLPLGGGPTFALDRSMPGVGTGCRWIDLDGDGDDELYVLARSMIIQLVRRGDGTWSARPSDLGSDVLDVIGGDLDGDGRRELIVAVGAWRAYDVRLVRAGAGGALMTQDRVRLGGLVRLADLGGDGAGGARIAAIKLDMYPSVRDLPAERPYGAPAGLYVLRLKGDRLDLVRHDELPVPAVDFPDLGPMHVADLDGDGHRDLVVRIALVSEQPSALVMLGRADGSFAARVVSGLDPLVVVAADADAADEVIARVDGEAAWILGGGDDPVPARTLARAGEGAPSDMARREPAIAAAWQRSEQLARIGQVEAAAETFGHVATLTSITAVKVDTLRRASVLLSGAGLPAAAPLQSLAELTTVGERERADAWLDAIDDDLGHAALVDAEQRVARLRASGVVLTPAEDARLAAQVDRLVGAPVRVFTGDALGGGWRVADPSLVHVVTGSRALTVETLTPGVVASLPLTRGERGVTVTIEGEIARLEWAGHVTVRLGPRDGAAGGGVEVTIGARGGGQVYRRESICVGAYPTYGRLDEPLPDADALVPVRIEISIIPERGRARCVITVGTRRMVTDLDVTPTTDKRWELSLGAGTLAGMTSAVARIATIELAGATPDAASALPLDAAALAIANHQTAAATALLDRLDARTRGSWPARRLAAIAAHAAGDRRAAIAALAGAMAAPPAERPGLDALASLARARDGQFAPLVRAAAGARVAPILAAAWSNTAHHDLDEPRVRADLIRELDRLPRATAETRRETLSLIGYHGEALIAAGRVDEGRRALAEALSLARPDDDPELRERGARIAYLLAIDSAVRGDDAGALRWAIASLDLASHPELAADRLLLDPTTRALAGEPGWERVRSLGRALAPLPGAEAP